MSIVTRREPTGDAEVFHEPDERRYVLLEEGEVVGLAEYVPSGDAHILSHTEVDPTREGRGLATRLMGAVLDDARRRSWRIVPRCSFVSTYVRRHPEYADLLVAGNGRPAT